VVDLGRPDKFEDSAGVVEIIEGLPGSDFGVTDSDFIVYTTPEGPWLWRVRFANFTGRITGAAGSVTPTFQALPFGSVSPPWPAGSVALECSAPSDILFGEDYTCTWNTEVADNYVGVNSNFGRTFTLGLPLAYLPGQTDISLNMTGKGGFVGGLILNTCMLQVERFSPGAVTGGQGANEGLYLLPGTG
jgi:hypothetical protein